MLDETFYVNFKHRGKYLNLQRLIKNFFSFRRWKWRQCLAKSNHSIPTSCGTSFPMTRGQWTRARHSALDPSNIQPFVCPSVSNNSGTNQNHSTLLENHSKCRIRIFGILAFSTNFCPIKIDLSGNTVWPQASVFFFFSKMEHCLEFLIIFCFFNM